MRDNFVNGLGRYDDPEIFQENNSSQDELDSPINHDLQGTLLYRLI